MRGWDGSGGWSLGSQDIGRMPVSFRDRCCPPGTKVALEEMERIKLCR